MAALAPTTKVKLELTTDDKLERRFIAALSAVYPSSMTGYELMRAIGMAVPLTREAAYSQALMCKNPGDFITFCNLRVRVDRAIRPHGWQAARDGGSVVDKYRLAPVF